MIVNSWNEWDPLEEVIVGSAQGATEVAYEPALSPFFTPANQRAETEARRIPQALIDDAERQLDDFANLLAGMGIVVRRPDRIDHGIGVKTPDWQVVEGTRALVPETFCW